MTAEFRNDPQPCPRHPEFLIAEGGECPTCGRIEYLDSRIDSIVVRLLLDAVLAPTDERFMLRVTPGTVVSWHDNYGNHDEGVCRAEAIEVTGFVWHRLRTVIHALGQFDRLAPDEVLVLKPREPLTHDGLEAVVKAIPEELRSRVVVINGESFDAFTMTPLEDRHA